MWGVFLQKERKELEKKRLDLDACKTRLRRAKSIGAKDEVGLCSVTVAFSFHLPISCFSLLSTNLQHSFSWLLRSVSQPARFVRASLHQLLLLLQSPTDLKHPLLFQASNVLVRQYRNYEFLLSEETCLLPFHFNSILIQLYNAQISTHQCTSG